jgi:Tol biopolymer transport system component
MILRISMLALLAASLPALAADWIYSSRVYKEPGKSYQEIYELTSGGRRIALTATPRRHRDPVCSGNSIYFLSGDWNEDWPNKELWTFDRKTSAEKPLLQFKQAKTMDDEMKEKRPTIERIFAVAGNAPLFTIDEGGATFVCKYRSRLVKLARGWHPALSPDGTRIAYNPGSGGELAVMNIEGKTLANFGEGEEPAWSPDGSKIAAITKTAIRLIGARDGKDAGGIAFPAQTSAWNYPFLLRWSPDGARILVGSEAGSSTAHYADLWLLNLADKSWEYLKDGGNDPRWSPDGKYIVYSTPRVLGHAGKRGVWVSHNKRLNAGDLSQKILTEGLSQDVEPAWCK